MKGTVMVSAALDQALQLVQCSSPCCHPTACSMGRIEHHSASCNSYEEGCSKPIEPVEVVCCSLSAISSLQQ